MPTTTTDSQDVIDLTINDDDIVPTPTSVINYAAATTAPGLNQRPTTAVLKGRKEIAHKPTESEDKAIFSAVV